MSVPDVILLVFFLYAVAGVATALAFVTSGISEVLPQPMPVTLGARILILPGAIALWPYILMRWRRTRSRA